MMFGRRRCVVHTILCVLFVIAIKQLYQTGLTQKRSAREFSQVVKQPSAVSEVHSANTLQTTWTNKQSAVNTPPTTKSVAKSQNDPNISFPHGTAVRSDVLNAPWVSDLRTLLTNVSTKHLNIVISDKKFQRVLLNWLIAALVKCERPLENVVVLALDKSLQKMLEKREIPSVFVDSNSVVAPDAKMQSKNSHIWITRTTVYRLLSFWGYDITIFDSDAVILSNPQPLFDQYKDSDIVGSGGIYPFLLGKKWGVTFCMGVAFFRHTPRTELLWEALSNARNFSLDDQVKLNYALDQCNISWSESPENIRISIQTKAVQGECKADKFRGLRVAVVSYSSICRKAPCNPPYYILHRNSQKDWAAKLKVAKSYHMWFLRKHWEKVDNNAGPAKLTGTRWLQAISTLKSPL